MPVRVVHAFESEIDNDVKSLPQVRPSVYKPRLAATYPADALVGNDQGEVEMGIAPGNSAPWCVRRPAVPENVAFFEEYWTEHVGATQPIPYCPQTFLDSTTNLFTDEDAERWSVRGAVNAGLVVFLYLDALAKGEVQRLIPYDRCEDLAQ